MPDLQTVCDACAASVRGINGLKAKGYVDTTIAPPEAQVYTRPFDPRMVFNPTPSMYELGIRVFVKAGDAKAAQKALRAYMDPAGASSVRAALETDSNWPDGVHFVEVVQIGQPFEIEIVSNVFWYVDFDFNVTW